ncbi:hypothetical protein ACHQM5_015737 [Ranunculus cassubicifolius]
MAVYLHPFYPDRRHYPNLCHHCHSSSLVTFLAFVSNSPSVPSKQHFHNHKLPSPWRDPLI